MRLFFNVLFGWVAILSCIALSIIWLIRLRLLKMPKGFKKDAATRINRYLRKNHIYLGYIFILVSLIHGRLSSFSIMSFNYGTLAFVIAIMLWYSYADKVKLGKKWIKYHRELTLLIVLMTGVHILEVGGFIGVNSLVESIQKDFQIEEDKEKEEVMYKDGSYEGIGYGFRPGLKVEVVIVNGAIENIIIKEHNEIGKRYYLPAFEIIPKLIIDNQMSQVDIVSRATYTSMGIIEAVEDALIKATH